MTNIDLGKEFPWLNYLSSVSGDIQSTLWEKEKNYQGSWQRRGGVGAFMMTCRKWDRIESICKAHGFDIFSALKSGDGNMIDDMEDLVGYLMLVLAEHRRRNMEDPTKLFTSGDKT